MMRVKEKEAELKEAEKEVSRLSSFRAETEKPAVSLIRHIDGPSCSPTYFLRTAYYVSSIPTW